MAIPSRNFRLREPDEARQDVQILIARVNELPAILEASTTVKPAITSAVSLAALESKVNIPSTELSSIFTALENLRVFKEQFGSSADALALLRDAFNDEAFANEITQHSEQIQNAVDLFTSDNPIAITAKAEKISGFYEKVLHDVEVLTDARPVFDSKGENVLEFIISHVLAITVSEVAGRSRIHLSMDASDLLKLRRACDRALLKSKTLKAGLGKGAWTVEVVSDADDNV